MSVRAELARKAEELELEIASATLAQRMQLEEIQQKLHTIAQAEKEEEERQRKRRWAVAVTRTVFRADCELTEVVAIFDTVSEAIAALPSRRRYAIRYEVKKLEIGAKDGIEYDSD